MGKSVLENVNKALKDVAGKDTKGQTKAFEEAAKTISKASKDATLAQAYQAFIVAYQNCGQPKLDKKYAEVAAESVKHQPTAAPATPVSKQDSGSSLSKSASTSSEGNSPKSSPEKTLPGAAPLDADAAKAKAKAEALARIKAGNKEIAEGRARIAQLDTGIQEHDVRIQARNEEIAESGRKIAESGRKIAESKYKIADLKGQKAELRYAALSQQFDSVNQQAINTQNQIEAIIKGGNKSFEAQVAARQDKVKY